VDGKTRVKKGKKIPFDVQIILQAVKIGLDQHFS